MIKFARLSLVALLLVQSSAIVFAQKVARETRWYRIDDPDYTLDMPGKPEYERIPAGIVRASDVYRVRSGNIDYLLLIRSINVSRNPKVYRDLSIKGHAIGYASALVEELQNQGIKARVVFDRDLALAGFPGKQYRVSSNRVTGVIRFYATNNFLYTLQALGAGQDNEEVAEFLNSFKVKRHE